MLNFIYFMRTYFTKTIIGFFISFIFVLPCFASDTLIDNYAETNKDNDESLQSNVAEYVIQSFKIPDEGIDYELTSVKVYLSKYGTPTGNLYMKLYACDGTFGVNNTATGSALATSEALDVSTLPSYSTFTLKEILFTDNYIMTANSVYCLAYTYGVGSGGSNYVMVGQDRSSSSASGNCAKYNVGWTTWSDRDLIYYIYGIEQSEPEPEVIPSYTLTCDLTNDGDNDISSCYSSLDVYYTFFIEFFIIAVIILLLLLIL